MSLVVIVESRGFDAQKNRHIVVEPVCAGSSSILWILDKNRIQLQCKLFIIEFGKKSIRFYY